MGDLKPCPFCGGAAELNDYTAAPAAAWVLVHRAKKCFLAPKVESFPSKEAALEAWNRRAEPKAPDAAEAVEHLGRHRNWELSYRYDDEGDPGFWLVHQVNGGRNDREWTEIGKGETPLEAIRRAMLSTAEQEGRA